MFGFKKINVTWASLPRGGITLVVLAVLPPIAPSFAAFHPVVYLPTENADLFGAKAEKISKLPNVISQSLVIKPTNKIGRIPTRRRAKNPKILDVKEAVWTPLNLMRVIPLPERKNATAHTGGDNSPKFPSSPRRLSNNSTQPTQRLTIFGSPALKLPNLPLAKNVQTAFAKSGPAIEFHRLNSTLWNGIISRARSLNTKDQIEFINLMVNTHIRYRPDTRNNGAMDEWAPAAETLLNSRGDCEDIAVLKMSLLQHLGFDEDDLFTVAVQIVGKSKEHAVTAVRRGGQFLILDNMTNHILVDEQITDYRPLYSASAKGFWLHGRKNPNIRSALQ